MNYRFRSIPVAGTNPSSATGQFAESHVLQATILPKPILRYTYYAFIWSLPLEAAHLQIEGLPLSRMLGLILIAVTVIAKLVYQRRLELALPPKAFWCFVGYLIVYSTLGFNTIRSFPEDPELAAMVVQGFKTQIQLLVLFWISYDVMQYERITRGSLLCLAASCFIVAVIQSLGITGDITVQERTAAFDTNQNSIAGILSFGVLVVIGLLYGRTKFNFTTRLFFWLCLGGLAVMLVVTGSRGSMMGLLLGLMVFFLQGRSLKVKLKVGSVVLLTIGFLGWISYTIQPVRERWEATYYEGDTAGRDAIFSAAWEMFLERPIAGWGPANHLDEIGSRIHLHTKDPHNTFLWLLTETGLLGTIPYLVGLWLCWCAAWRARYGTEGALPMSLMVSLLIRIMSGSFHWDKLFWFVLAYALSSDNYVSVGWRKRTQAYPARSNSGRESTQLHRPPEAAA